MPTKAEGWETWPYDLCWMFIRSSQEEPGRVRIGDTPGLGERMWDIHVRTFDQIAQDYMTSRTKRHGVGLQLQDGTVRTIPYRTLDDDADMLMQRNMKISTDNSTIDITFTDGTKLEKVTAGWYEENILRPHLERRKAESPIPLDIGDERISLPFEFFDAMCKDFMRRRADCIAAQWWPELLIRDQSTEGPMPVEGRANAFGHGVKVINPKQDQAKSGQVGHPAVENQELV